MLSRRMMYGLAAGMLLAPRSQSWETPEEFGAFAKTYTETSSGLLRDSGLAKN